MWWKRAHEELRWPKRTSASGKAPLVFLWATLSGRKKFPPPARPSSRSPPARQHDRGKRRGHRAAHKHANSTAQWRTVPGRPTHHTLPRPLLPMETERAPLAHACDVDAVAVRRRLKDNKLFQGQIADKNPFFHPAKKDQE